MDETEVKNGYKTLQKSSEYTPYINNIERLKSTLTPKQNIELKAILVGASSHEGALKARSLQLFDKKIKQIDTSLTKESKENSERANRLITHAKIQHSHSIRLRKLKSKKFNRTRRPRRPALSPIIEGSRETDSRSKSPWKTVAESKPPVNKRGWLFGLF
jgi:hypothetical protein